MWEMLTGEEPYANMHCGAIIGKVLLLKPLDIVSVMIRVEVTYYRQL